MITLSDFLDHIIKLGFTKDEALDLYLLKVLDNEKFEEVLNYEKIDRTIRNR